MSEDDPEITVRRVTWSTDWRKALDSRRPNGSHAHPIVGDSPQAGWWRIRRDRADPIPVHIIELCPTDEMTGELAGDVTYECFMSGAQVAVEQAWPWCGKLPISEQEYERMLNQDAQNGGPATIPHPGERQGSGTLTPAPPPPYTPPEPRPDPMRSAEIDKLAEALAKAQGDIEGATKDASNPAFKQGARVAAYATLASVWEACRKALSSNGLAVTQTTRGGDLATVTVITTLLHASGQWMRSDLTMKPMAATPQGIGSAITYARRYALAAMVGVAPEDDDGEGAMGRQTKPEPVPHREDDVARQAAEFANGLMAQIEACKSPATLVEIMAMPKNKGGVERLEASYPDLHKQVTNVQQRKALQLTKAAA